MTIARFTLAHWCVLVAALLPIVCAGIAKWGTFRTPRSQGGYDNVDPRAWLARQTDWRARANAAQANSFEALPFFIGAVVIAHQLGAPQGVLDILASDYVPLSMLRSAFMLIDDFAWAPERALATVAATPARSLGLNDRGEIAPGQRADLLRVAIRTAGWPVPAEVWRQGTRVA